MLLKNLQEISAGAGFSTTGGTFVFGIKENNYLGKGIALETNGTLLRVF